jgi:large subunit ribosomal protein L10
VDRAQKEQVVASLREAVGDVALLVVTQQSGLTVAEATDLRRQMRRAGANFRVTKNRLARLALKDTKFAQIVPLFTGPTAIATSKDPVAAAKVTVEFAKKNGKLTIIGGVLDDRVLGVDDIKALAALPSLDELRARIVGLLSAPATRIATVLGEPAAQMARLLRAHSEKDEAA